MSDNSKDFKRGSQYLYTYPKSRIMFYFNKLSLAIVSWVSDINIYWMMKNRTMNIQYRVNLIKYYHHLNHNKYAYKKHKILFGLF